MLLRLMSEGNEDAFAKIFRFYAPRLGEYVLSIIGNRETTEEIIQDVFMKVWRRRASVTSIREFSSYLFIMTRNAAMSEIVRIAAELRKKKSYREWSVYTNDETLSQEYEDNMQLVDQAIERLPSQQQQVYKLGKREGLSYKDIGREMQINPSTVKRYMYIATQSILRFIKTRRSFFLLILLWRY
jgi:RNA polymerase sigma-70 factor (ECF subfamily)